MSARKKEAPARNGRCKQSQQQNSTTPRHELEPIEVHDLAKVVPEMSPERYEEFCADIKAKGGLTDPNITLYEGKILDGRHRDRACRDLGIPRKFEQYGGDDPAGFVISRNIMRRDLQLSDDQRVALIAKIRGPQLEEEAKERQRKAGGDKRSKKSLSLKSSEAVQPSKAGKVAGQIAREAKVSTYKGEQAEKARKKGTLQKVITGEQSLKDAAKGGPSEPCEGKGKLLNGEDSDKDFDSEQFKNLVWKKWMRLENSFAANRRPAVKYEVLRQLVGRSERKSPELIAPVSVTYADDSTALVKDLLKAPSERRAAKP